MPDPEKKEEGTPNESTPLTEEQVGNIVNSAVTAHLKKAVPRAITEAIGALKIDEQISAAVAKLAPSEKEPKGAQNDDDASGGRVTTKDLQRQLSSLQDKLDASERKAQDLERQRIEVEQGARMSAALTAFRNGVQSHVKPELLEPFVDYFARGRGLLKVDDQGAPTLTVKRAPYKGAPPADEDLPLMEAIPLLLGTDDAKPFIPAPGGHSDGQQRGTGQVRQLPKGQTTDDPFSNSVKALEEQGLLDSLT